MCDELDRPDSFSKDFKDNYLMDPKMFGIGYLTKLLKDNDFEILDCRLAESGLVWDLKVRSAAAGENIPEFRRLLSEITSRLSADAGKAWHVAACAAVAGENQTIIAQFEVKEVNRPQ